jgi:haloalkane dehalogenase
MAPVLMKLIPGARNVSVTDAGHFLQEDAGERLGALIAEFVAEYS